jgi:small subunit ribosomal protein S8
MMTDPISDMLTRIRNGAMARKAVVSMPYSLLKNAVAKILVAEGYVASADKVEGTVAKELRLELKYDGREPVIRSLKRVSTPGRRVYAPYRELAQVLSGHGIAIVSTSQGVMTDKEARKRRLGGEVLCEIF